MIMPNEHNIKTRYLFCNKLGGIFIFVSVGIYIAVSIIYTRMKKPYEQIGIFFLLNNRNPFFSRFYHIFEYHSFPDMFWQPVWNCGSYQTKDCNLNSFSFYNCVWLKVWFIVTCVDSISS